MFWQMLAAAGVAMAGAALAIRPRGWPAAVALAVLSTDWGALLWLAGQPGAGTAQATAGVAAAAVIGLAGEPKEERGRRGRPPRPDDVFAPVFRAVVVSMGLVVAYGLAHTLPLAPQLAGNEASFSWYWLIVVGLMLLLFKYDLVCTGYGLVLLSLAGPSFHAVVATEESLGVSIAGAAATVALAVLLAHLGAASREPATTAETEKGGT